MKSIITALVVSMLMSCNSPAPNTEQEPVQSISYDSIIATSGNWIIAKDTAIAMIKHFGEIYRHEKSSSEKDKIDSLSKAVWFSKEMIAQLNAYLQDPKFDLDGVRIYMGAYSTLDNKKAPGQVYANQSTLVFVPTNPGAAGAHKDNWDVIKNTKILGPLDAMNHGSLCPQICDSIPL